MCIPNTCNETNGTNRAARAPRLLELDSAGPLWWLRYIGYIYGTTTGAPHATRVTTSRVPALPRYQPRPPQLANLPAHTCQPLEQDSSLPHPSYPAWTHRMSRPAATLSTPPAYEAHTAVAAATRLACRQQPAAIRPTRVRYPAAQQRRTDLHHRVRTVRIPRGHHPWVIVQSLTHCVPINVQHGSGRRAHGNAAAARVWSVGMSHSAACPSPWSRACLVQCGPSIHARSANGAECVLPLLSLVSRLYGSRTAPPSATASPAAAIGLTHAATVAPGGGKHLSKESRSNLRASARSRSRFTSVNVCVWVCVSRTGRGYGVSACVQAGHECRARH